MAEPQEIERLRQYRPFSSPYTWERPQSLPRAAVLVAIQFQSDIPHVILTLRSPTLTLHPGEVSLPGGKYEKGDQNPIETALREAREEIGLQDCQVVCQLTPLVSRMGILVFPVVAIIPESFKAVENKDEVQLVFTVPLELFLRMDCHSTGVVRWHGSAFRVHEFHYHGQRIWALTANILIQVALIALNRSPQFDFDYRIYTKPPSKSKI